MAGEDWWEAVEDDGEDSSPLVRRRWWESIAKVVGLYEQVQPFKVATACSGIESPITAAKAVIMFINLVY